MKLGARVSIKLAMGLSLALACVGTAFAGGGMRVVTPVPTLDEFGLIGLGTMVGVAGLIILFRRKK